MFRAAASGPYDDNVAKATDENLTAEDWATIIDICDRVSSDTNGPRDVVQSLIRRLAHRNANVQLYTLELTNALTQNCGKPMHREVASRSFTEALLKLANDRNTHAQVKTKIAVRMSEWTDMFKSDSELGMMSEAFNRLKQTNPTLQPPSAPQKNNLTDLDRQKEEEELQMALQLSLQEEERRKQPAAVTAAAAAGLSISQAGPSSSSAMAAGSSAWNSSSQQVGAAGAAGAGGAGGAGGSVTSTTLAPTHSTGTTAATVSRVRALFDFTPSEPGELEFKKGEIIAVLESVYKDWWRGSVKGRTGIFPLNYVEKLADPTPEELAREAQMEAEVFAEIKNVEKLLTLLSTNNAVPREADNEEISKLYHQTLAIRPKLIKLIEKYSQKKDDFTQLNEKFIKARRAYESLLESSMSQPAQPAYNSYGVRPPAATAGYGQPGSQGFGGQPPDHQYYGQAPPQEYGAAANFQRPNTATPAPFYLAGSEVPAANHSTPGPQGYPPRDQAPPGGNPSSVGGLYASGYQSSPHMQSQAPSGPGATPGAGGPPSGLYYGVGSSNHPQELATSSYDSSVPTTAAGPQAQPPTSSTPHYTSYQPRVDHVPSAGSAPPVHEPSASAGGGASHQYKAYVPPAASAVDEATDYYRGYGK